MNNVFERGVDAILLFIFFFNEPPPIPFDGDAEDKDDDDDVVMLGFDSDPSDEGEAIVDEVIGSGSVILALSLAVAVA